jgi:hypothetical protein
MKRLFTDPDKRPFAIAALILIAGLGVASGIYFTTDYVTDDTPLELTPEYSRKYARSLELIGGKANLDAVEFMTWFNGLWQGKNLAFTVAAIALIVSLGYLLAARRLRSVQQDRIDP